MKVGDELRAQRQALLEGEHVRGRPRQGQACAVASYRESLSEKARRVLGLSLEAMGHEPSWVRSMMYPDLVTLNDDQGLPTSDLIDALEMAAKYADIAEEER